jgi:hypothetical protein
MSCGALRCPLAPVRAPTPKPAAALHAQVERGKSDLRESAGSHRCVRRDRRAGGCRAARCRERLANGCAGSERSSLGKSGRARDFTLTLSGAPQRCTVRFISVRGTTRTVADFTADHARTVWSWKVPSNARTARWTVQARCDSSQVNATILVHGTRTGPRDERSASPSTSGALRARRQQR